MKELATTSQLLIFNKNLQKLEFNSHLSLVQEVKGYIKIFKISIGTSLIMLLSEGDV